MHQSVVCKPTKTPSDSRRKKKEKKQSGNWQEACMQDHTNQLIYEIDVVGDRTILEARDPGTQLGNFVSVAQVATVSS